MKVAEKIPVTWEERLAYPEELIRFQDTFEDFLDIAGEAPFKVEYLWGEIIQMGQASDRHELIVANLIGILYNLFYDTNYRVYGSNRLIYAEECKAGFQPDISVNLGEPQSVWYQSKKNKEIQASLNPALVIEVLSKGTKDYDHFEKLPCYKTIPSLQQIIFVEQEHPWASIYTRTPQPNEWLNIDYKELEQKLILNNKEIPFSDIYRNVAFDVK